MKFKLLQIQKWCRFQNKGEISEMNIIVSTPVYERCFAEMKTKKTLEFKQKALSEAEEVERKGIGRGGGRPQPLERSPPSSGIPKGRGRVPTSSKPVGVPGKQSSSHKHNPFSALAAVVKQSAKAAKRKEPDFDDGDEGEEGQKKFRVDREGPSQAIAP